MVIVLILKIPRSKICFHRRPKSQNFWDLKPNQVDSWPERKNEIILEDNFAHH